MKTVCIALFAALLFAQSVVTTLTGPVRDAIGQPFTGTVVVTLVTPATSGINIGPWSSGSLTITAGQFCPTPTSCSDNYALYPGTYTALFRHRSGQSWSRTWTVGTSTASIESISSAVAASPTNTFSHVLIGGLSTGDLIYRSASGTTRLPIGSTGQVLTVAGGLPTWAAAAGGGGEGTVTSVGLTAPNIFSVANSPVTSSGTIALSLATQTANYVWAGPTTGSAAAPTFRALVSADIPDLGATYGKLSGGNSWTGTQTFGDYVRMTQYGDSPEFYAGLNLYISNVFKGGFEFDISNQGANVYGAKNASLTTDGGGLSIAESGAATFGGTVGATAGFFGPLTGAVTGTASGNSRILTTSGVVSPVAGNGAAQSKYSYTLPGGTLGAGECVNVVAVLTHENNAATFQPRINFGAINITPAAFAATSEYATLDVVICNNPGSTTAQTTFARGINTVNTTVPGSYFLTGTVNTGSNVTISADINCNASDSCGGWFFMVNKL